MPQANVHLFSEGLYQKRSILKLEKSINLFELIPKQVDLDYLNVNNELVT